MIIANYIGIGNTSGGGEAYSEEYQAVLDKATSLGYTHPSEEQQDAQNQLIVDLKAAGIWDLLDVFYVFACENEDFARINWKNPEVLAEKVGALTFTANRGFSNNGLSTSVFLDTNFNPSTQAVQGSQNSNAMVVGSDSSEIGTSNSKIIAGVDGTGQTQILTRAGGDVLSGRANALNTDVASGSNNNRLGNYMIRRESSSAIHIYKNGVLVGSDTSATSQAFPNLEFAVCGRRAGTSLINSPSDEIVTHFGWGNIGALFAEFNTAWNAYFSLFVGIGFMAIGSNFIVG